MHTGAPRSTDTLSADLATRRAADFAALADRIQLLRSALPAMAEDLAHARREIQQLRRENARLKQHLTALSSSDAATQATC
jgi:cell shape-determining protein MreC